ncbi:MAG: hypothetical protein IRY97_12565, partial [Thermomicrobiaceae bacterium]|nr:hypothetical protein [Thermomicrobiaceae bacterium]
MSRGSFYRASLARPRGRRRRERFGPVGPRPNRMPVPLLRGLRRRRSAPLGLAARLLAGVLLAALVMVLGTVGVAAGGGFAAWAY